MALWSRCVDKTRELRYAKVPAKAILLKMFSRHVPSIGLTTEPDRNCACADLGRGPGWITYLALFFIGVGMVFAASRELGFSSSVTAGLVEHLAAKFGPGSTRRIGDWQGFIRAFPTERRAGGDLRLLEPVNAFFNRVPFVSDMIHWRVEDYWASPAEMIASDGGDCEDFSIAKYFALKELGVPIERLRITYVKAVRLNQAHMVLAYYATPGGVPLILDNLDDEVRPASDRTDLVPVYSFNDEDLLIVRQNQPAVSAGGSSQVRQWSSLLAKLERELLY